MNHTVFAFFAGEFFKIRHSMPYRFTPVSAAQPFVTL
jgi:hypothetical protein